MEKKEIKKYQKDLLEYFDNVYPEFWHIPEVWIPQLLFRG